MTQHSYSSHVAWDGTTAGGYRAYSRDHAAVARPARDELALSADPAFRGNPELLNPEQLLVVAASSCQLLSFLAVAARAGLDIRDYEDEASAVLDTAIDPVRITRIALAPVIRVAAGTDHESVRAAARTAHDECYIANTLNCTLTLDVTVEDA
ncbi:OsmC family protein [Rathayibacter sp. YIM 133350]|uniref:OsmC family protein n=1 Tax=Rathayibacter sp. YIM 133350 TaxID=3131992 RepID=UPI00307F810F